MPTTSTETDTFDLAAFSQHRRQFIKNLGIFSLALLSDYAGQATAGQDLHVEFTHGVASGDPLADRLIIWSRAISAQAQVFDVVWLVATDADLQQIVSSGTVQAHPDFDYTLKIDVHNLQPDTRYYYRFMAGSRYSPIGQSRTLPSGEVKHYRLAQVSCANYVKGYFNVYAEIAKQADVAVVLHLGDYIYEYGPDEYLTPANTSQHLPQPRLAELVPPQTLQTLADYRQRYALQRSDTDLQTLHRLKPFIAIWDDHEFADDAWQAGAKNFKGSSAAWLQRRDAGIQAYYEWLPIREPDAGLRIQCYRSFALGNLARLILLDTRLIGRDQQLSLVELFAVYAKAASSGDYAKYDVNAAGQARGVLGAAQQEWLQQQLTAAAEQQVWQILVQQVLFAYQTAPNIDQTQIITPAQKQQLAQTFNGLYGAGADKLIRQLGLLGGPNLALNDSWTGYPGAKSLLAKALSAVPNPVVLTGDSHNAWAANLKCATNNGIIPAGVEIAGPSVTAPGAEEELLALTPEEIAAISIESSQAHPNTDDLLYAEAAHRGYVLLDIRPERIQSEWYFVDTVLSQRYRAYLGKILSLKRSDKQFMPEISASLIGTQLFIPQVVVDQQQVYSAVLQLSLLADQTLEFTLQALYAVNTKGNNPAYFAFATGVLQLPLVDVAGQFFSATLHYRAGSQPMCFSQLQYQTYRAD